MHETDRQAPGVGGKMNGAAISLLVFGLYMIFAVGAGFMFAPKFVLDLSGLSAGDGIWVRFVGMLASILGAYYIMVARAGLDRFHPWTVATRYYAATFMIVIVLLGEMGPGLILIAAIDVVAATWT
ncbi:MAG: hypothetical protein CMJ27_04415 [Phycisphaerae bacterium]|nr:hypothetical protein [Phycisphaerae bacterium]